MNIHKLRINNRLGYVMALAIGLFSLPAITQAADLSGMFTGGVTGWVTDKDGNQVAPQGAVSGNVSVNIDDNGTVIANITGTGSCKSGLGVHIDFIATYNSSTGDLSGTYTTPANSTPTPLVFTNKGGLNWSTHIDGSVKVEGTTRLYSIDVALALPDTALFSGTSLPADKVLSGSLNKTISLSVPVSVPEVGIDELIAVDITLNGSWGVNIVPLADGSTTLTGTASGTFTAPAINLTGSVFGQTIPVSLTLNGNFGGSLFSSDLSKITFSGTYSQSDATLNYSDSFEISVPINQDGSISEMPFTMSGNPSITAMGQTITVPVNVTGSFPFSLK